MFSPENPTAVPLALLRVIKHDLLPDHRHEGIGGLDPLIRKQPVFPFYRTAAQAGNRSTTDPKLDNLAGNHVYGKDVQGTVAA